MYLKGIEIFGFKSFADRTELEFVPGVTAVVGPNGSGKSNISDSVRWVLGEQSAKSLRGAKMEDIIFSGSDSRKPLNYGEVSLTLDNTDAILPLDYSEITVTRRVYRSGESEFFINKQACRLKDITELFMDTGLGREAYSIIGQGRIEEILSTKAEDRRGILEEAAGVVKYKNRKKEAARKLEETESNLIRIHDIMAELEDQLEPLERQVEEAKQYKLWRAALEDKEISTYVYLIESTHSNWETLNKQVEQLQQDEAQLAFQVNEQDVQVEKLKWMLSQVEEKLDTQQINLLNVTEDLEKLEGQRGVLLERKKNFSSNKEDVQAQLSSLDLQQANLVEELAKEMEKSTELKRLVAETEQILAIEMRRSNQLNPDLDKEIEEVQGDYVQLMKKQAAFKKEIQFLEQVVDQEAEKLAKLEQENQSFLQERSAVKSDLEMKKNVLVELEHQLQQLKAIKAQLLQEIDTAVEKLRLSQEKMSNYQQQVEKLKDRRKFLQEMKDDFAGFFQGVKEVLKARGTILKGIHGAVAELIQVPKEYELALETALGASLQHIVVQDEEAGRLAISFLKKNKLGRATFLPLNVLRAKQLTTADQQILLKADGVVGLAADLIHFEAQYKQLISNLLGQVIITTELKLANQLAKKVQYRYRFVTLEGDLVNFGGSMTGGSLRKNSTNILGRDTEITHLGTEIEKGKQAMSALALEVNKMKLIIEQLDQKLSQIQSEEEHLKEKELVEKEKLAHVQYALQRVTERLEGYDIEVSKCKQEQDEAKRKIELCAQHLITIDQELQDVKLKIKDLEHEKQKKAASKAERSELITQLKVKLARQLQEEEERERSVERIEQSKQEVDKRLKETKLHLEQLLTSLAGQDDLENELEQMITEKKVEKDDLTKWIDAARTERRQVQKKLEDLEKNVRNLRLEQKQLENKLHREEVKANRLDVELENYLTSLSQEYELSFELARERYPLTAPFEEVKAEVEKLKLALQQLGEVNLGSIEEYERLHERFKFLEEQEADLQEAKASLYKMINEMDQIMIERFSETYTAVRTQFQLVFQELFGGGRADMLLTEPDDLLTTGIDIIAQPPGKRLQHLGLLSGGERALTAIAILFAILKVKPVPFCILDEVEAALDEANVQRFAHYLKEFSKETQFIVITHRKGTMEGADVLYGITMQESGVSKIVSVKLEDSEKIVSA